MLAKADKRNTEEAWALALKWRPLIIREARRWTRSGASLDDLVQDGMLGAFRAAQLYDESAGVNFSTFAVWHIRNRMRIASQKVQAIHIPQKAYGSMASGEQAFPRRVRDMGWLRDELVDSEDLAGEVEHEDLLATARRVIETLPDPQRTIVSERFGITGATDGCFHSIGALFGFSRTWAQQQLQVAIDDLRAALVPARNA